MVFFYIGEKMRIWNINEKERNIRTLNNDITADILIIGGGITGMTTSYLIKDKNVCLVDANLI